MTDADAFLRAIVASPDDDLLRLVYADWLEEQGDPRGEFIRTQIALARWREGSPGRPQVEARESELLEHHQDAWLGPLRVHLARWTFRRGFLDTVAVPASIYLQHTAIPCPATVRRFGVDLVGFEIPPSVIEFVPESVARENIVFPLGFRRRTLVLAMKNPQDADFLSKLEFILNRNIEPVAASGEQIIEAIEGQYGPSAVESVDTNCFVNVAIDFETDEGDVVDDESPVARLVDRLVDLIVAEAMGLNATEIRIDPEPDRLRVCYRIGGQWVDRDTPPRRLLGLIVARIRLQAGITFTGKEPEQAGRMGGTSQRKSFDLGVLIRQTEEGPGVLLRFLSPEGGDGPASA